MKTQLKRDPQLTIVYNKQEDLDRESKKKYLKEFLESNCDLFSSADWYFYVEETGKELSWLREHANYSDPNEAYGTMLENAIIDGDFELAEFYI